MTAIDRLVTTGAGEPLPAAFVKLDRNDARLQAKADDHEFRLASFERAFRPPGAIIGGQAAPFRAEVSPVGMVARGYANYPVTQPAFGIDADGRSATILLTDSRFVVVSLDNVTSTLNATLLRATVFNVAESGALTQVATQTFCPQNQVAYQNTNTAVLGGARVADNVCRVVHGWAASTTAHGHGLHTITFDPATNALSITTEINSYSLASIQAPFRTGALHRRRSFLVGANGLFVPCPQGAVHFGTAGLLIAPGGFLVDRTPGSGSVLPRTVAGCASTYPFSIDRVTDNLFVTLSDGFAAGLGLSAILTLSVIDDQNAAGISTLRFGVGMSGNARCVALSETLFVVGFSTGSQYATYLVERDPVTNALRQCGSMAMAGNLGANPVEILRLGPTRFLALVKGANWQLTGSVYECDRTAGAGVSPFAAGATFSANLGVAMPAATAADALTFGGIEFVSATRLAVTYRNSNRSLCGAEILDLV